MRILAFDPSKTKTGWALWDTTKDHTSMTVGSFSSKGETYFEAVDSFTPQVVDIIREHGPDFIVSEEGLGNIPVYKSEKHDLAGDIQTASVNAKSSLVLHRLLGALQAIAKGFHIPHEEVAVLTWRKAFLGYGRKTGMDRKAYKKAARQMCETMRIHVTNDDQAEAVGISFWAGRCSQQVKMLENKARAA